MPGSENTKGKVAEGQKATTEPGDFSLREAVGQANTGSGNGGIWKTTDGGRDWILVIGLLFIVGLVILLVMGIIPGLPLLGETLPDQTEIKMPSRSHASDVTLKRGRFSESASCIDDLTAILPTACMDAGDGEEAAESCQPAYVAMGDLGNDWLVGGTGQAQGGFGNDLLLAEDVINVQPQAAEPPTEEVSIVFHNITWVHDTDGIPPVLVVPLADGGGSFDPYKNFKFKVSWGSTPSNTLDVHPIIDPDTGEVIGPTIVVYGDPDDVQQAINGNSMGTAEIDFVEHAVGGEMGDGKPILVLLMIVPRLQIFPENMLPLCEPVSIPPPDTTEEPTEEPPDSSVPVSTEEPTDEPGSSEPPPAVCGDLVCDPNTENTDLCPSDCQCVDDGVCAPGEGDSCQDCGASAGTCGSTCVDSSQCASGLACSGGVCWDALTCGSDPGGSSGGGGGNSGEECTIVRRVENPDNPNCPIYYDSCGGSTEICN